MPARAWPLWLLTFLLLTALPLLSFFFWNDIWHLAGVQPDGDDPLVRALGSVALAMIVWPAVLVVAWFCLRDYNPATRFTAWRMDRPVRSILATLLLGGGAAALLITLIAALRMPEPAFIHVWIAYAALWIPWLLILRASSVEQLPYAR